MNKEQLSREEFPETSGSSPTHYDTIEKDLPFKTKEGGHPGIRVNVLEELPKERQILALMRLWKIVEKRPLKGYDDTTVGAKNTECSWGMCQQNDWLWPDPQDYIWPHQKDRIAPLDGVRCPLDTDHEKLEWGCFYRCRFFGSEKFGEPLRKEVLFKIKEMIEKLEEEGEA